MRGIGFTAKTTDPQSASSSTAAGVCVCVFENKGTHTSFLYHLQEVQAEIKVSTSWSAI